MTRHTRQARPDRQFAVGLIVADDGRLLLQHRDDTPGLPGAGLWGFFGGHVEPDERASQAFLREMHEELGWRPRHFEPFTTRAVDGTGWRGVSHVFAAHLDVPLGALKLREGQEMALFPPDALPRGMVPGAGFIAQFATSDAYRRVKRAWPLTTTTALIVDREGRFLLQHRDDRAGIANPGLWGSFGGELEPYETPQEGLLRELREELAWEPRRYELYAAAPWDEGRRLVLVYVFGALLDVPPGALTLGEGQGMALFAPGALPATTVPALRTLIAVFTASDAYTDLRSPAPSPRHAWPR